MGLQIRVGGVNATIVNIRQTRLSEKKLAKRLIKDVGKRLEVLIRHNMRARDHSQADLDALDHPYALRHGSIRIHQGSRKFLQNGQNVVHTQSGALLAALQGKVGSGGMSYSIGLDRGTAPHAPYVVQGTRVMLPRDVLWDTATAPGTQVDLVKRAVKTMGKVMRTQAIVRFQGLPGDRRM